MRALNDDGKATKGARVLVLGLAYKANIDDDRESPSYELISLLEELGAVVDYCDPYFATAKKTRRHDLRRSSTPCTAEAFANYDAVVVATAHDMFKDPSLYQQTRLVVDTRNMMAPLFERGAGPRVVKA
jgi:UDP-N-acetyl-D-glucosamine dehydrogenase